MQRAGGLSAKLRPPWWSIAALALLAAIGTSAWLALNAGPEAPAWQVLLLPAALLLTSAIAAVAGLQARFEAERREWADSLRDARARLTCVDEVLDVWQFRTDASHRLVELRPPQHAPEADWQRPTPLAALWDVFRVDDPAALQARMAAGAALDAVEVRRHADAAARVGVLHARPHHDGLGAFAGYHGVVREPDVPQPPSLHAAPAAVAPVDGLLAEQESLSFTVSHDLRAPIRVVEGFTKIIKEDYGRLLDRVGNDHLDRVLGAAARMNNMIDALLALSRLASQPLARQPVNLSQLAGYVADDLRRQTPERQVTLTIEPGIQLTGDPTLLRVVLENLLGNAWKYTAKNAQAQVALERNPSAADTFTVRDNGAGFDMRFADRLFGVFQRLHSANDFPGTGIGLASVRRIVRRHGGEIWGEAEVQRGAKFHFSLPQSSLPQSSLPQSSWQRSPVPRPSTTDPSAPPPTAPFLSPPSGSSRDVSTSNPLTSHIPPHRGPPSPRPVVPAPVHAGREPPSSPPSNLSA